MEMWCPDDTGRDIWDWVGPPAWGRTCFNSPEWSGGSSPVKTEPPQIVLLLLLEGGGRGCWGRGGGVGGCWVGCMVGEGGERGVGGLLGVVGGCWGLLGVVGGCWGLLGVVGGLLGSRVWVCVCVYVFKGMESVWPCTKVFSIECLWPMPRSRSCRPRALGRPHRCPTDRPGTLRSFVAALRLPSILKLRTVMSPPRRSSKTAATAAHPHLELVLTDEMFRFNPISATLNGVHTSRKCGC